MFKLLVIKCTNYICSYKAIFEMGHQNINEPTRSSCAERVLHCTVFCVVQHRQHYYYSRNPIVSAIIKFRYSSTIARKIFTRIPPPHKSRALNTNHTYSERMRPLPNLHSNTNTHTQTAIASILCGLRLCDYMVGYITVLSLCVCLCVCCKNSVHINCMQLGPFDDKT